MPADPPPSRSRPVQPLAGAKTVQVRRRTALGIGVVAALALAWAGASTLYIVSRDELAQRFFVSETEMKFAYEDRIGRLSGHLEREVTQNLVERSAFEARVAALASRQAEIEARQAWLRKAAERVTGLAPASLGDVFWDSRERAGAKPPASVMKPEPIEEGFRLRNEAAGEPPSPTSRSGSRDRLSALEGAVESIAREEQALVAALGRVARSQVSRLRSAIDATGIDLASSRPAARDGIGGPLVPLPPEARRGHFGFLIQDLGLSFAEISRLEATARSLPLGVPLAGEVEQTSGFGVRLDPFTRGPALHTGLDFRAEIGTPARATAAGRVVAAEYAGGYGNLVEIDHGGGLTTRYGHLSSIAVVAGERVDTNQVIGRTGSTGRSTGAHLHYETRINGEPVNPARFLSAGRLLAASGG